jgi:hydrogenase maturation protein HypF
VGDLETAEAVQGLEQVARTLPLFLRRTPRAVAVDLHPDMQSSILGRRLAQELGVPLVEVQHHHAHGMACLAEHGRESGLALVFDGAGLGTDGAIWGAELLHIAPSGFRRLATFAGVPLPGGDAAVRRPVRQLVARWVQAGVDIAPRWIDRLGLSSDEVAAWTTQCRRALNAPQTHGAGRLFDSFSALLGFAPAVTTYEGQPAIRLEAAARRSRGPLLRVPFRAVERDGLLQIDWSDAFRAWHDQPPSDEIRCECAMAVHAAIADAAAAMIQYGLDRAGGNAAALSGGVFMNRILNDLLVPKIERLGVECLVHAATPPNDGCIALGQAVVGGG